MKNTIILQSCKKFSNICRSTISSLNNYLFFDEVILATDDSEFSNLNNNRLKLVLLDKDFGFSSNMLRALDKCDQEYALIILDDYILPHPKDQLANPEKVYKDSCDLLSRMKEVSCVRLNIFSRDCADFSSSFNGFVKVKKDFKYICSLQPSVWRLNDLRKILKNGEDAWQAEINGSKRMRKMGMQAYISTFEAMRHINAMRHGKYIRDKFVDYADKNNIDVPVNMDVFVKIKSKDGSSSTKIIEKLNKYRSNRST